MFFSNTVVVLSLALSAFAVPHIARGSSHHGLARRAAIPDPAPEPLIVPVRSIKKRASGRCRAHDTTTTDAPPSTSTHVAASPSQNPPTTTPISSTVAPIVPPKNVASDPAPTKDDPKPTKDDPTPTSTKHTTTHTSTNSAPQSTSSQSTGGSGDVHSGDGTFYGTGLGACGITSQDTDYIVAVSQLLYDTFPGYEGGNPNNNPICKRKIKATYQGKSVTVTVVDRCVGCDKYSLDFSPTAFNQLADFAIGRLHGVTWFFV